MPPHQAHFPTAITESGAKVAPLPTRQESRAFWDFTEGRAQRETTSTETITRELSANGRGRTTRNPLLAAGRAWHQVSLAVAGEGKALANTVVGVSQALGNKVRALNPAPLHVSEHDRTLSHMSSANVDHRLRNRTTRRQVKPSLPGQKEVQES